VKGADPSDNAASADAPVIKYRDITAHPGCTTDGLAYPAAVIPGFKCAAKAYPVKGEDPKKPIVLLVHGNSSTPADYEKFPADSAEARPMLSERLGASGFRVYAIDLRKDKSDDPSANNDTENAAKNFDHAWAVPLVGHLVESVMAANPGQKVSIVGFSVGPTIVRDALRRLHRAKKKPFESIAHLVYAAGSHHGVSSFRKLCGTNPTMRGKVACELGDRTSYTPTDFLRPLNGEGGAFETPCADGDSAYGQRGVCGGNKVKYTTLVMKDIKEGTYQDEFVSEGSSALAGAQNFTVGLTDQDDSGYFYNGLFKNHYGALRSEAALKIITDALSQ
jgi:pimeloyl-ACP methyl ester carboxylesterase